ncbi:MAG: acyl-CoA dehydrogenase [Candidatus Tectimicrobiota bacterium]|nr:MAG: acyl-CoA dehydrogenase [Candidatus Tectomicrobia bacterium]
MDFEVTYTPEQEAFRAEVRAWLAANVPPDLEEPVDPAHLSYEQYGKRRELGRKLGAKGWLYPTYPPEYGGGGLSVDFALILEEELDRYGLHLPPYYDSGGRLGAASILVWGSEEQKRYFLPPMLTGQWRTWQLLSEPGAGSDLAAVQTRAVRDGDHYVINGQKIFIGSLHGCEMMWTLVVTDPEAPRHHNLSWFMIPADLPGIEVRPMELLTAGGEGGASPGLKHTVFFDNVRVPAFHLIGGENNGWKVATTHLELEHGGGGLIRRHRVAERFLEYCLTTKRHGVPLSQDPDVRDDMVEVYIKKEIVRLLGLRTYWLSHANRPRSYEGPQLSYCRKVTNLEIAEIILRALGPYTLTTDPAWAPLAGLLEHFQRAAVVGLHPGGTTDIQKVVMARRLGIGRTVREEAGRLR